MKSNKKKQNNYPKKEQGITVIALIVAVIILVLLASISIGVLNNGLIDHAGSAKENTEIAGEKEILKQSILVATVKSKYNSFTQTSLQNAIDTNIGEKGKAEVLDEEDKYVVHFIESNRYYEINGNGNINAFNPILDKNPGNISRGINGEVLNGSEASPFEIWCIEDLVEWSQNYNNYKSSYIRLMRTLNFNSKLSYVDGKKLNCSSIDELKNLLTDRSGEGFTPVNTFNGKFDGQNYEIKNIYINRNGLVGLIGTGSGLTIKNLKITGSITSKNNHAGGFIGSSYGKSTFENLVNESVVESIGKSCGGIIGYTGGSATINLVNCENLGNINSTQWSGGLIGYSYAASTGYLQNLYIYNSFNAGIIKNNDNKGAGGICGSINSDNQGRTDGNIYNCLNSGKVTSTYNYSGGIFGQFRSMVAAELKIYNTAMVKKTHTKVGQSGWKCIVDNNTSLIEESYIHSQEFINGLNLYIESNEDSIDTTGWVWWQLDADGNPTLNFNKTWNGTEWVETE